ncbi:MAG: preprotein translocase subunit YajC, partial [Methylophilaceae bacterium]|nr:preprotein translocase subunit YajC [Methylophilaceae bacterium]
MFISSAYAASGAASSDWTSFVPMVVIFVLFYFMLVRPQMKQAKEQRAMIEALKVGDEVVTSSGILGKVTKVADNVISLEIAPNIVISVQKPAIQAKLEKGTIK